MSSNRKPWTVELTLASLAGLLPLILAGAPPLTQLPSAYGGVDPLLQAGILQHVLRHSPMLSASWNAPFFWPAPMSLAFMDPLMTQSLLVSWLPAVWRGVAVAYNMALGLTLALAFLATAALARQVGLSRGLGWLAGFTYVAGPYAAGHYHHLNQVPTPWLPLALLGILETMRGHRAGPALMVGAGILQIWSGVYAAAALGVTLLGCLPIVLGRLDRNRVVWLGVGVVLLGAAVWAYSLPYQRALELVEGYGRTASDVGAFAARPFDLLHPPQAHLLAWPSHLPGRPVAYVGLIWPWLAVWGWWQSRRGVGADSRALLGGLALAAGLGLVLAFGRNLPLPGGGHVPMPLAGLQDVFPALRALRAPSRLLLPGVLWLSIAGAAGVGLLWRRGQGGRRALAITVIGLAVLDLMPGRLESVRAALDPDERALLSAIEQQSDLWAWSVVPQACDEPQETARDARIMIWAALTQRPVAGGASGFVPLEVRNLRSVCCGGPNEFCLVEARRLGVTHLVLLGAEDGVLLPDARRLALGDRWQLWKLR